MAMLIFISRGDPFSCRGLDRLRCWLGAACGRARPNRRVARRAALLVEELETRIVPSRGLLLDAASLHGGHPVLYARAPVHHAPVHRPVFHVTAPRPVNSASGGGFFAPGGTFSGAPTVPVPLPSLASAFTPSPSLPWPPGSIPTPPHYVLDDASHGIYQQVGASSVRIGDQICAIATDASNTLYALNYVDHHVYQRQGGGWVAVGDGVSALGASGGSVYAINFYDHNVYQRQGSGWLNLGTGGPEVTFGAYDSFSGKDFTFRGGAIAPNGFNFPDVQQGLSGDCVFCAAMASAANAGVNLGGLIQYLGGAEYRVSLIGETSQIVPFDGQIYKAGNQPLIDGSGQIVNMWVLLLERAYLQIHGVPWNTDSGQQPGWYWTQAWSHPKVAEYSLIGGVKNNWDVGPPDSADGDAMQKMSAALASHNIVTVGCTDPTILRESGQGHQFAVLALWNFNGQMQVLLDNPHNGNFVQVIDGQTCNTEGMFQLSWSSFSRYFNTFTTCGQDV
jgi:hypothetical protein